jgi:hypothetical protein
MWIGLKAEAASGIANFNSVFRLEGNRLDWWVSDSDRTVVSFREPGCR